MLYGDNRKISNENEANVTVTVLRPNPQKCFARTISLQKVAGLDGNVIEILNGWYLQNWRLIHQNGFNVTLEIADSLKDYLNTHGGIEFDIQKLDSYLSSVKLLYNGLRNHLEKSIQVSKDKRFQEYYYTARENPIALNSCIVMSNLLWALQAYLKDDFAITCLLDVLLQAYPAALDLFIRLGGVTIIKKTLDHLAINGRLSENTNYLLKCLTLLNKLDISFKILQVSKIGIPVNGLATAAKSAKLGINYECNSDQVKLKSTDLIKKWKAIRDAAAPIRPVPTQRPKPTVPVSNSTQSLQEQPSKPDPTPSSSSSSAPKGSFVLNILDSIMEQREKERQRKLASRKAQKLDSIKKQKKNLATSDSEIPQPISKTTESGEDQEDTQGEIASLVDFFRNIKQTNTSERRPSPSIASTRFPQPQDTTALYQSNLQFNLMQKPDTLPGAVPSRPPVLDPYCIKK
ncbi:bifunctional Transcription factor IIS [Babesia duncani]|uniref:Bifunctional Transcription factor IIS n=1 Tax=Babesia duncani TaxID=323732 RepID=A0AAD9UQ12_9APIC|nr:bifunctional Transcription factor IIS [Babesia duncani]